MSDRGCEVADEWDKLPTRVKLDALALEDLMQRIQKHRKVAPAVKKYADTAAALHLKFHTLRKLYYKWLAFGAGVLINHNKCGGCGLAGCGKSQESHLPEELLNEWRTMAGGNDKRGLSNAWRVLVGSFSQGQSMPGIGSWQQLWSELYPLRDIPSSCPWSPAKPPPGWSKSNFMSHRQTQAEYDLEQKGFALAVTHLPFVQIDMSKLRPLEYVVFDDHRLDFKVLVTLNGRTHIVELWGLFAMDVATRRIIAFGLQARMTREDGTVESFSRRDMQHLVAGMLSKVGYPKKYTMTLIVENAAAALSEDTERLLARVSGGQIIVRRTGVGCGDLHLSGFPEKWGNPRGKGVIESVFNPLDIILGTVKGQTGSNYIVKPGDQEGRLSVARKMSLIIGALPERERQRLMLPFEHVSDALKLVSDAIKVLNTRDDHKMRGFDEVREWRWSSGDPTWKPLLLCDAPADVRADVEGFLAMPEPARETILRNHSHLRPESPLERWNKLWHASDFHTVTPAVYADLYLDVITAEYRGGDVIDLKLKRSKARIVEMRYRGSEHHLQPGSKVLCRLDADRPQSGVWFTDELGRYLGSMQAEGEIADTEKLKQDLGTRMKAQADLVQSVSKRLHTADRLLQQIEEVDTNIEVISTLADPPRLETAPEDPQSVALVEAVQRPRRKRREFTLSAAPAAPTETPEAFSFEQ